MFAALLPIAGSLLGGGSSAGGSSTSITNVVNSALKIFGIKDLSCLGSQAFNKSDLEMFINDINQKFAGVKTSSDLASILTYCNYKIAESVKEIASFRSQCSKDYRQQYIDNVKQVMSSFDLSKFSTRTISEKGVTYIGYTPIASYSLEEYIPRSVTPGLNAGADTSNVIGGGFEIPQSILSQLQQQSSKTGIPLDTLRTSTAGEGCL